MDDKLREIEIENYIVYIYFIILGIYLYANNIELDYLRYGREEDKEKYRMLLYIVFGTTFIITLFYSVESLYDLNNTNDYEVYKLKELSTIANLLVLVASVIIIYTIYKDRDINLETIP